jgi:hypothetical protein
MSTMPTETELLAYLDELIEASRAGKIPWGQGNPTTFVWDVPNRARITLQQTSGVRGGPQAIMRPRRPGVVLPPVQQRPPTPAVPFTSYVFQVQELATNVMRIHTQNEDTTSVGKKLAELYQNITTNLSRKNLDFLKSLVPKG